MKAPNHAAILAGAIGINHPRLTETEAMRAFEPTGDPRILRVQNVEAPANARPKRERERGLLDLVHRTRAITPTAEVTKGARESLIGRPSTFQARNHGYPPPCGAAEQFDRDACLAQPARKVGGPGFDAALNVPETGTGDRDAQRVHRAAPMRGLRPSIRLSHRSGRRDSRRRGTAGIRRAGSYCPPMPRTPSQRPDNKASVAAGLFRMRESCSRR